MRSSAYIRWDILWLDLAILTLLMVLVAFDLAKIRDRISVRKVNKVGDMGPLVVNPERKGKSTRRPVYQNRISDSRNTLLNEIIERFIKIVFLQDCNKDHPLYLIVGFRHINLNEPWVLSYPFLN